MLFAATESALGPTLAVIIGIGMLAQWLAWRTQVPSIILLLVAGLLLGPVFGVVDPDVFLGGGLFPVVSLSVALILFGLTGVRTPSPARRRRDLRHPLRYAIHLR